MISADGAIKSGHRSRRGRLFRQDNCFLMAVGFDYLEVARSTWSAASSLPGVFGIG
jgi:hypothetical protein